MKASELIGKKAIRTAPPNGFQDMSYCSGGGVTIAQVTQYHVIIKDGNGWNYALPPQYNDDKWVEATWES